MAINISILLQKREENRLKLERLRSAVKEGFDLIDDGKYQIVNSEHLEKFLASVSAVKCRSDSQ